MSEHVASKKTYYMVFVTLMVLLIATVGVAYVQLGALNIFVALGIAGLKAAIIVLYFMHVKDSSRLVWVAVGASVLFLGILLGLLSTDYISRDWLPAPGVGWEAGTAAAPPADQN